MHESMSARQAEGKSEGEEPNGIDIAFHR